MSDINLSVLVGMVENVKRTDKGFDEIYQKFTKIL